MQPPADDAASGALEDLLRRAVTAYVHMDLPGANRTAAYNAERVEYRLTQLGGTLLGTIQSLVTWTEEHRPQIALARERFDDADGVLATG